jgi:hypothetical protein
MSLQLFMLFSIKVSKKSVMERTNIYDFLHLLNLIKIRPNMDFGGNLAFTHICTIHFFFFFFSQRDWRKVHIDRLN